MEYFSWCFIKWPILPWQLREEKFQRSCAVDSRSLRNLEHQFLRLQKVSIKINKWLDFDNVNIISKLNISNFI